MADFRLITDRPLPDHLYLDAGAFLRAIISTMPDNSDLAHLLAYAAATPTRLYTSGLIFPEVNDAVLKEILRRKHRKQAEDAEWLRYPDLIPDHVWDAVGEYSTALEDLIGTASITTCKVDGPTRQGAYELQKNHKLRAFDAIHLATCRRRGLAQMVTFDTDFFLLPDLTVWTSRERRPGS